MAWLRWPRLRWWGWLGVGVGLLVAYLIALSVVPALLADDGPKLDRTRARRAITAENWSLVLPEDRVELEKAVDAAWRSLRAYRMVYRAGTPAELAADTPAIVSESVVNLGEDGRIRTQRDTNYTGATAPGSGGQEQRFEGYRILTDRPYTNARGRRVGDAELIYQQSGGAWSCQRSLADEEPVMPPSLRFVESGDAGFGEIDGHRVRAFSVPAGAFGLRAPATVWVDVESLLVRRQEIESAVRGQREVWTFGAFDEATTLTPPSGVACTDG